MFHGKAGDGFDGFIGEYAKELEGFIIFVASITS
jgi:hypothetical protein